MAYTVTKEKMTHARQLMNLLPAMPTAAKLHMLRAAGIHMSASDISAANQAGNNQLAKVAWQVYSETSISEIVSVTAPLTEFSTDISDQMVDLTPEGVQGTVHFEVIEDVAEATKDKVGPYGSSAIKTRWESAALHRYESEFQITAWDLASGQRIENKINDHAKRVFEKFYKDIILGIKASNAANIIVPGCDPGNSDVHPDNLAHFGPRYIAHKLSPAILPSVDSLVLNPEYYATTQAYNILGFEQARGTYGIGTIAKSMYMETLDAHAVGFMGNRYGLGIGARTPQLIEMGDTRIFPLTTTEAHGIPMVLKQWYTGGSEVINMSVILLATSAVLSPKFLRVLKTAEA